MQALVINVKESHDRWDFMVDQLKPLGIHYSKLVAFDLACLNQDILERYQQSWERPLRKAEVGCFLSHKSAWQKVVKENKPYLVLEDDVIISKDIVSVLNYFDKTNDYGLINFETTHRLKLIGNSKVRINDKYSLRQLFHNKTGSAAYIIWPSMAKKLLFKYSGQKAALADAALYTNFFKFKQFQLYPAPIVQLQYAEFFNLEHTFCSKSTISHYKLEKTNELKFLIRRIKIQILCIFVYLVNVFRSKRKQVELA